jgi:gas vesicle protein
MNSTPTEQPRHIPRTKTHAAGSPYRKVRDKRAISMLGIGLITGAVIGAGVALMVAPESGEQTRDRIKRRVRKIRGDDTAWEKLGKQLQRATLLKRRDELERRKQRDKEIAERQRADKDAGVKPV